MKTILQTTADGSHTLYVPELDEHYHSTHGAIGESMHVYIDAGLRHCLSAEINLLEIGFGTGLNAFLTTYCAKGVVRRMLQSAGYIVEHLPGPPGKREILRAGKASQIPEFPG